MRNIRWLMVLKADPSSTSTTSVQALHCCAIIDSSANDTFTITQIAYQSRSEPNTENFPYIFFGRKCFCPKLKMNVEFKCQPHDILELKFAIQWNALLGAHWQYVCV